MFQDDECPVCMDDFVERPLNLYMFGVLRDGVSYCGDVFPPRHRNCPNDKKMGHF